MSFNFGPTLLSWLEASAATTYRSILDADRESRNRFSGHGSAIAQAYNHVILPLANARDKVTQVHWGIRDFEHRFGRRPEGMWLPETAADEATLDVLAAHGIAFTILSPHQATGVDSREPYRVPLSVRPRDHRVLLRRGGLAVDRVRRSARGRWGRPRARAPVPLRRRRESLARSRGHRRRDLRAPRPRRRPGARRSARRDRRVRVGEADELRRVSRAVPPATRDAHRPDLVLELRARSRTVERRLRVLGRGRLAPPVAPPSARGARLAARHRSRRSSKWRRRASSPTRGPRATTRSTSSSTRVAKASTVSSSGTRSGPSRRWNAARPSTCSSSSATRSSCTRAAAGSSTIPRASRPDRSCGTPREPSSSRSKRSEDPSSRLFLRLLERVRSGLGDRPDAASIYRTLRAPHVPAEPAIPR